jgi:amidophosphoribosyltransferase
MTLTALAADLWTGSRPDARDPDDDRPRLECGVFGVLGVHGAAAAAALGLHALQHRGQEACGIASFDGQRFYTERHMGHVGEAFGGADLTQRLPGEAAIGHTRYSTAGGSFIRNVQPMFADLDSGGIALAHNGNLTNFLTLRHQLVEDGAIFQSTSDSEVILHLIARSRKAKVTDRFIDALRQIEGGYALVAITNKKLIGARDPLGIRPLVLGELDGKPVLASETVALDMIGGRFVRDIEHGEVVIISETGIESLRPFPARHARPCVFEYVYFARPDSVVNGHSVYDVRKRMGARLAQENPADVDVVVPVPDSGLPAALGYAQESGKPFDLGIIRSHYAGRTFIQPTQGVRELGVRMKHSPNRAVLAGKRVLLIDDSIVRGRLRSRSSAWCARRARARCICAAPHRRQVARLLRHRHARPRQAPRRHQVGRGDATHAGGGQPGLPVGRGPLLGDGRGRARPRQSSVHRPLFHGGLPNPPARSRDRRGAQRARGAAAVPVGERLRGRGSP